MCQAQEQRPGEIGRTGRSRRMGNREILCCKYAARGCQEGARQKGVDSKFPEASRQSPAAGPLQCLLAGQEVLHCSAWFPQQ